MKKISKNNHPTNKIQTYKEILSTILLIKNSKITLIQNK